MRISFLMLCLLPLATHAHVHPAAEIAAAELAFARQSVSDGLNTAFAAHFADDAVDFTPLPRENAREFYVGRTNPPVELDWYPAYTLAAASGDFGLSTGPFVIADLQGTRPDGHGHYISIWRKHANGTWKVAIDGGVSHPQPAAPIPRLDPGHMPANQSSAPAAWRGTDEGVLLQQDVALSERAREGGRLEALLAVAAKDVRFYREGALPVLGRTALMEAEVADETWRWEPQGAEIAASGDLGFTYGMSTRGKDAGRGAYLHVWRREQDGWRLLLSRDLPLPAAAT